MRSVCSQEPWQASWTRGPCHGSGTGRPRDHPEEAPGHTPGGRIFTATRDRKGMGRGSTQEPVPGTRDPARCPGAAIRWQPIRVPDGTNTANWKRGGLMEAIPEAFCQEAPKGQPVIRRETLVAVSVEAPKGQPRNHRRHPKQVILRPTGEEEERKEKTKGPQSSRLTKTGKKGRGVSSPDPLHGELDASRMT